MGLFDTIRHRLAKQNAANGPVSTSAGRICRIEQMEPRVLLAADLHFGAVYFEEATGDDTQADVFEVTYEGGVAGTQLSELVIDGDKKGNGRLEGDVFFDIAGGGLGAFGHVGLTIESHVGFEVIGVAVVDGGSQIVFNFSDFDAGEKLVFSIDVDEISFIDDATGAIESTSVVEGGEFQRARISAEFAAPHHELATLDALFWDAFDDRFATAVVDTGTTLDLRDDRYDPTDDLSDRTAGAVVHAPQTPLPISIAGTVFLDDNLDNLQAPNEVGIAGVNVGLWVFDSAADDYVDTGRVATTDILGDYQFETGTGGAILPGRYEIRETHPDGFFSVGASAGTVDGATVGVALDADTISRVDLVGGQNSIDNDFAEALPGSISGRVHATTDGDCVFGPGDIALADVRIDLLDAAGSLVATTFTDTEGRYTFGAIAPGEYQVFEHQADGFLDGDDHPGTAGGVSDGVDTISGIRLTSGTMAVDYNFCEHTGIDLSGFVYHDADNDGVFDAGESGIAGVALVLLDEAGNETGVTATTDGQGRYVFVDLVPGQYGVAEIQPLAFLDGLDTPGNLGGTAQNPGDRITGVVLPFGQDGENYNFGELLPGSISGRVHASVDGDCVFDPEDIALADVRIDLLDAAGNLIATTVTDAEGRYTFDNLAPGEYQIFEHQPDDFFDGDDHPGSGGGISDGVDTISGITVASDALLVDYDFCELLPGSIAGRVFVDADHDLRFSAGDPTLEDVVIQLVDGDSQVLATTATDSTGQYRFTDLRPGVYTVHELQPVGFFQGDEFVGSGGGEVVAIDLIGRIVVASGAHLIEYDFTETPAASLSGFVFQDGEQINTFDGEAPENLHELRDGQRSVDDTPLAGVTLELRQGVSGEPIQGSVALPGTYTAGPIRAVTDGSGFYEFVGLPPGTYAIFEVQPSGFTDGVDTPGSLGGLAVNPNSNLGPLVLSQLLVNPANDAILRVPLAAGRNSIENNFSEVLVGKVVIPEDPPEVIPRPVLAPAVVAAQAPALLPLAVLPVASFELYGGSSRVYGYTWHLSVIDAGQPRASGVGDSTMRFVGSRVDASAWDAVDMRQSEWTLATADQHDQLSRAHVTFGNANALPVSGDFNGDGTTDVGVFIDGEWFIDLNGNGQWDEGDLWAKLGHRGDLPITGDWDGDGKTDIGVFGPAWAGDPVAIFEEPGLPDHQNSAPTPWKNIPPAPNQAAVGARAMRRTSEGTMRADVIDHVFHYGSAGDTPVTGDWNGDGIDTIGVFRDGAWHIDVNGDGKSTEIDGAVRLGQTGDVPVVGDWNGDGVDQIGVYRAGRWLLDTNGDRRLDVQDKVFELGGAGDVPIVGDWDGDGRDEPGVYHPTSGQQTLADD